MKNNTLRVKDFTVKGKVCHDKRDWMPPGHVMVRGIVSQTVQEFPYRRADMKYELTVKLRIESPFDEYRVKRQVESLFDFGTVSESFADGLKLDECPHFLSVDASATSARAARVE